MAGRRARHGGLLVAALVVAAFGKPTVVRAQAGPGGSIVVTTDYVFRGLSQTRSHPALQADLHYQSAPGWFAGTWLSSIDPPNYYVGDVEWNLYAGWTLAKWLDWTLRPMYVRYVYPESRAGTRYDYGDMSLQLSFRDRVSATVAWSPDSVRYDLAGVRDRGNVYAYELALNQPLVAGFVLAGGVGYYDVSSLLDRSYRAWSLGLSWNRGAFELDLAHFGTDAAARELFGDRVAGGRWALTAIWHFQPPD